MPAIRVVVANLSGVGVVVIDRCRACLAVPCGAAAKPSAKGGADSGLADDEGDGAIHVWVPIRVWGCHGRTALM